MCFDAPIYTSKFICFDRMANIKLAARSDTKNYHRI